MGQWNGTASPEINPYIYDQLISDQIAKTIQCEKYSLLINAAGTTGYPRVKECTWTPMSHNA